MMFCCNRTPDFGFWLWVSNDFPQIRKLTKPEKEKREIGRRIGVLLQVAPLISNLFSPCRLLFICFPEYKLRILKPEIRAKPGAEGGVEFYCTSRANRYLILQRAPQSRVLVLNHYLFENEGSEIYALRFRLRFCCTSLGNPASENGNRFFFRAEAHS